MTAKDIAPDVLAVLKRSVYSETSVKLPDERLSPELYKRVNKVLAAAGGSWNRKVEAHLFTHDPRPALGLALETGTIVDVKQATQAYYTPVGLAQRLIAQHLSLCDMTTVLEPSAGSGAFALAAALTVTKARITCVELDPMSCAQLIAQHFTVTVGDFLLQTPEQLGTFGAIAMNPPFTKGQDIAHVQHAWRFLKPGGELLAIMAQGFEFQSYRRAQEFREFLAEHGRVVEHLPTGTFKESGTMVATVVVKLCKPNRPRLSLFE